MSEPPSPPSWPSRDARHLLVSGAQMAALEEQLFASGLPVEALMEKAALAVSRRLLAQHGPRLRNSGAVVLVGPGHNGGDGLVIARELHLAGIAVEIWSPFERSKPLTALHRRHADWLGIAAVTGTPDPGGGALWIDALLGIGQRRPPGELIEALLAQRQQRAPQGLVAVDVPTGLCSDSGICLGQVAARASQTLCIGLIKQGLVQDQALAWVGQLERIDLGLPAPLLASLPQAQPLALAPGDLANAPWPRLEPAAGKYARGRVLVVAGSRRFRGAGHLALAGASAAGCGSLRAAGPAGLGDALQTSAPHVVVSRELDGDPHGNLLLAGLSCADLERLDAVLVGPGLGCPHPSTASIPSSLAAAERESWERLGAFGGLLVLDADGLNRLAVGVAEGVAGGSDPTPTAWLQQRRGPTWITPHAGEFARLFPQWAERPPLEAAAAAACQSGVAVVLKGARSVVAAPDGRCWQLLESEPNAARAGLGDVLAGYVTAVGAMALAASGEPHRPHPASELTTVLAPVLAAATLAHAEAGRRLGVLGGPGRCSPPAIAAELAGIGLDPARSSGDSGAAWSATPSQN
ncbi:MULTISPECIES: NAD(P)H-hydrate epimerase [Aphanothece]|uniref:NAD(P)H-hydrate epimerase n=1 Tax=Aphanothece TaxID=1121 RepID=UPI0039849012